MSSARPLAFTEYPSASVGTPEEYAAMTACVRAPMNDEHSAIIDLSCEEVLQFRTPVNEEQG